MVSLSINVRPRNSNVTSSEADNHLHNNKNHPAAAPDQKEATGVTAWEME